MTSTKRALRPHGMTPEQIQQVQAKYGKGPFLAADLIVVTVRWDGYEPTPWVLLIERRNPPHAGSHACPGGFVDAGEDLEAAARRELAEETGLLDLGNAVVEQVGAYGRPDRDPRGRVVGIAYLALVPWHEWKVPQGGDDAVAAAVFPWRDGVPRDARDEPLALAFDHDVVIGDAWACLQRHARTDSVLLRLLPPEFTLAQAGRLWACFEGDGFDAGRFEAGLAASGWVERHAGMWRVSGGAVAKAAAWWGSTALG